MGRSRGGLTSKIHAVVDTNGLPVQLALTTGEAHDNRLAGKLLSRVKSGSMLLADRGYDADWIRALAAKRCAWANVSRHAMTNSQRTTSPSSSLHQSGFGYALMSPRPKSLLLLEPAPQMEIPTAELRQWQSHLLVCPPLERDSDSSSDCESGCTEQVIIAPLAVRHGCAHSR
jgi:transposase